MARPTSCALAPEGFACAHLPWLKPNTTEMATCTAEAVLHPHIFGGLSWPIHSAQNSSQMRSDDDHHGGEGFQR